MAAPIEFIYSHFEITLSIAVATVVLLFLLIWWQQQNDETQENDDEQIGDQKSLEEKKNSKNITKKKKLIHEKKKEVQYSHALLLTTLKGHSGKILDMDFSSNEKYLASCADDRSVMLWSVKTFNQKDHKSVRANVEYDHAKQIKWSPDSKAYIICQASGNSIQVYKVGKKDDGSPGNIEPLRTFPEVHKTEIINIGIACNGRFIFSCSSDTTMIIWDLKGEILEKIDTHHINNYYGCVSPCGRFVASSGFVPDVKVWEVLFAKTGEFKEVKRAFELKGHSSGIYSFAFSNDSTRMASVSKDGTWKLWDTNIEYQKGQEPYLLLTGHYNSSNIHNILALSGDGRTIAISSLSDIYIFSGITGEEQERLEEIHSDHVAALQFSSNGQFLLAAVGRHIRIFRNIIGFKNAILDLEDKKKKATNSTAKSRLQSLIETAEASLKALEEVK